jgi:hypothetical protein
VTVTLRFEPKKSWPVAEKVTWVALTGTETLAGTLAVVVFERASVTAVPLGAGPLSVIVPVEVLPPEIDVGLNEKPLSAGGCTVSVVEGAAPWLDAVIVPVVGLVTGSVLTANPTLVLPAGTNTLEGTLTMAGLELLRATLTPPVGAVPVRVTVPWLAVLATTEVGLTETLAGTIAARTVRTAVLVPPR